MRNLTIYGDSISAASHGNGGYARLLRQSGWFDRVRNEAISGSGLTRTAPNSLYEIVIHQGKIDPEADWILIWHGSNDWFYGSSSEQFTTDFQLIIHRLRESSPKASILVLEPLFRWEGPRGCAERSDAFVTRNAVGWTLVDYRDLLRKLADEAGLETLDMNQLTGFSRINGALYYEDMVHPNEEGAKVIGRILLDYFTNR